MKLALVLLAATVLIAAAAAEDDPPLSPLVYGCDGAYPTTLDVALYWARATPDGTVVWERQCPLAAPPAAAYAPERDTLIFMHGAQPDFVEHDERVWLVSDEGVEFALSWLAQGWNVAIFQATQFMDEPLEHFEAAEGKIWNAHYYGQMRYKYRTAGGRVHTADAPATEDLAHIALRHYVALFGGGSAPPHPPGGAGPEVRLVGHSLGTQLALRVAFLVGEDERIARKVDRVALLDPVHSDGAKTYFRTGRYGHSLDAVMGFFANRLRLAGTAVEVYKTSMINRCLFSSQTDAYLVDNAAVATVTLNAWGDFDKSEVCYSADLLSDPATVKKKLSRYQWQITNRHIAVVPYYLLSLVRPPTICTRLERPGPTDHTVLTSCPPASALALSAAMPTPEVREWQRPAEPGAPPKACFHTYDDTHRDPAAPTMTLDPGDDAFYLQPCAAIRT